MRLTVASGVLWAVLLGGCVTSSVNTTAASAVASPVEALLGVASMSGDGVPEDAMPVQLSEAEAPPLEDPAIIEWPITFDAERARLTAAYLKHHREGMEATGDDWVDVTMIPRMVVLHHTAGPTAESAWNTFSSVKDRRKGLADHQKVNLSTHFVIDRDGTIYRLFDETLMGRHTIGLNHVAIGVENVGGVKGYPLTAEQVEANVALIRYLKRKYPTISHVIGHHEYRAMESHPYFDEADPKFRTIKVDPGPEFMARVREGLDGLALAGAPGEGDAPADEAAVASNVE